MAAIDAFDLETTGIDDVAKRLGELYRGAKIAKDPMFGWVQIVNDVTILIEDLRRGREEAGARRAVKVMMRLFEFIGYYLHHHDPKEEDFATLVARALRRRSYETLFGEEPQEGPMRWILAKYPEACSKCGRNPCHCLLRPWVIEERREKPDEYRREYKDVADAARGLLGNKKHSMTILAMLRLFRDIYQNTYYSQEPWKVGMHLAEEVGEATTELSRLGMAWRGRTIGFPFPTVCERIRTVSRKKVEHQFKRPAAGGQSDPDREQRKNAMLVAIGEEVKRFEEGDPWDVFTELVTERFKEEVADVFSWLAAVLVKLDRNHEFLRDERKRFVNELEGGSSEHLKCPWCAQTECGDHCLVSHGVSSEIVEKISKF